MIIDCIRQNPNSSLADVVGGNEGIVTSPRIKKIIDCALRDPDSLLGRSVRGNKAIQNLPTTYGDVFKVI